MKLKVSYFGRAFKKAAFKYTFTTDKGAECTITDLSGAVIAIRVPDKKGVIDDVVLGFDDPKQYISNPGYLGALIGPVGNRIAGASYTFGGKKYSFTPNEGTTLLHSGSFGFHTLVWDSSAECFPEKGVLTLKHFFPTEETGWPGNLDVTVTYTFSENNSLRIDYKATTDAPSFMSPTNHTYFNIAGLTKRHLSLIDRQCIEVFADKYTAVKDGCIPVGNESVEGTPFDLRTPVQFKAGLANEETNEQMQIGCGYDHNFVLSNPLDLTGLRHAARVSDRISGRVLNVYTDMPCMQLYTANHLNRYNPDSGKRFTRRHAVCLETQCAPDSINRAGEEGFDVITLDKEHPFSSSTVYEFLVNR